jgi:hypothetical protein
MLTREQRKEAEAALADVQQTLRRADLTNDERMTMELHAARLAGLLLGDWFPAGWFRRTLAAGLAGWAIVGPFVGFPYALLLLAIVAAFSPRIVGELSLFVGQPARVLVGAAWRHLPRRGH